MLRGGLVLWTQQETLDGSVVLWTQQETLDGSVVLWTQQETLEGSQRGNCLRTLLGWSEGELSQNARTCCALDAARLSKHA
jgi:hypothetical protein